MDLRLREIFPNDSDKPFGGRSVLLLGDFYQLPPVFETPLYAYVPPARPPAIPSLFAKRGRELYRRDSQAVFRQALQGLRIGRPSVADWHLLTTRVRGSLAHAEAESFRDAVHIYPTKARVAEHNRDHMLSLGVPVLRIVADNTGPKTDQADSQMACGLSQVLPICIGARVMLTNEPVDREGPR
ncbi:hypothetical protein E4U60_006721 [Claviceps pazoutovae]|uniref:ATP-dependent DNA helicase n=1 Tax=Claviceps pazoutovae TaxID=1649127 RepID=A0A9P7SEL9_9HYPO|nr:hypothetical protein E4U60_006721 [Claviceps pazoutovae]